MSGIVTQKCVRGSINGKVRELALPDAKPTVSVPRDADPKLVVTRYGNTEALPISVRVAEELIALGLPYGD